jgi:stearoyl-CoA desaturase (delta-9 desaturase)
MFIRVFEKTRSKSDHPNNRRPYDWSAIAFLAGTLIATAILLPLHLYYVGLTAKLLVFTIAYSVLGSLSITAGYHRLFSHKTYVATAPMRLFYLVFASGLFQTSALEWSVKHRRHHRYVETEKDPYNIKKGFFYAHMGWIFFKSPVADSEFPADLKRDPLVSWQHRHYLPLAVVMGFGVPVLAGWALGSWWGGLTWAGFFRIVFLHHCCFLVNSYAHTYGQQPYSDRASAGDSLVLSLLCYGEGYHSYHHKFPCDYRNGVRWYDWDPTKWLIRTISLLGWAKDLKRTPPELIRYARGELS